MFLVDALFAVLIALIFTVLLAALGRTGPGPIFLFLILFLLVWAGAVWMTPVGHPLWGGYWMNFVIIGLLIALLVGALAPPVRTGRAVESVDRPGPEKAPPRWAEASAAVSILFWVLAVFLVAAILGHYLLST